MKLNITFFIPFKFNGKTPFEQSLGGTESAVVYSAIELAKKGHNTTVISDCNKTSIINNVKYIPVFNETEYTKKDIDILIIVRYGHFIQRKINSKITIFWTGDDIDQQLSEEFNIESFNGKLIDKIFLVSNYQAKRYINNFGILPEKIYITKNGFNPEPFINNNIKRNPNKLIYISTPYRGLEILVKIFPEIKKKFSDIELDVYSSLTLHGVSSEKDKLLYGYIYDLINNTNGINLCNPLPQPLLAKKLLEAYLLVYPNIFPETSCISAIESQAAGTPVITSNLGALPETVSKGGILIEGNPYTNYYQEEFITNIVNVINNKDIWNSFSENGKNHIFNNYTWEKVTDEWIIEFKKLLETNTNNVQTNEIYNYYKITSDLRLKTLETNLKIFNSNLSDKEKKDLSKKILEIEPDIYKFDIKITKDVFKSFYFNSINLFMKELGDFQNSFKILKNGIELFPINNKLLYYLYTFFSISGKFIECLKVLKFISLLELRNEVFEKLSNTTSSENLNSLVKKLYLTDKKEILIKSEEICYLIALTYYEIGNYDAFKTYISNIKNSEKYKKLIQTISDNSNNSENMINSLKESLIENNENPFTLYRLAKEYLNISFKDNNVKDEAFKTYLESLKYSFKDDNLELQKLIFSDLLLYSKHLNIDDETIEELIQEGQQISENYSYYWYSLGKYNLNINNIKSANLYFNKSKEIEEKMFLFELNKINELILSKSNLKFEEVLDLIINNTGDNYIYYLTTSNLK